MEPLQLFPMEIWEHLFSFVPVKEARKLKTVCRLFVQLAEEREKKEFQKPTLTIQRVWKEAKQRRRNLEIRQYGRTSPPKIYSCSNCEKKIVLPMFFTHTVLGVAGSSGSIFPLTRNFCWKCFCSGLVKGTDEDGRLPFLRKHGYIFPNGENKIPIPKDFFPPLRYYCNFYSDGYLSDYVKI